MPETSLKLSSVEITTDFLTEKDGKRKVMSIPRDKISDIRLCYGSKSERPVLQVTLGVAMVTTTSYFLLKQLLLVSASSTTDFYSYLKFSAGVGLFTFLGFWIGLDALKKRLFLLVKFDGGQRKIVFQGKQTKEEIDLFLNDVKNAFGYEIIDQNNL